MSDDVDEDESLEGEQPALDDIEISPKTFGKRLRRLYLGQGYTRASFSKKVGIAYNTLQRYETGETSPDIEKMVLIAQALGVGVLELFTNPVVAVVSDGKTTRVNRELDEFDEDEPEHEPAAPRPGRTSQRFARRSWHARSGDPVGVMVTLTRPAELWARIEEARIKSRGGLSIVSSLKPRDYLTLIEEVMTHPLMVGTRRLATAVDHLARVEEKAPGQEAHAVASLAAADAFLRLVEYLEDSGRPVDIDTVAMRVALRRLMRDYGRDTPDTHSPDLNDESSLRGKKSPTE